MAGTPQALPRETRELLRQNVGFFSGVVSLLGNEAKQAPLDMLGKDRETRLERSTNGAGDVVVDFIYPLDNNDNPSDGRIYLKDRFIFDASEQDLKKFERSFQYNGLGSGSWREWLQRIQKADLPSEAATKAFALSAGRSYARPLSGEDPKIMQAMISQKSYLAKLGNLARAESSDYKLVSADALNRYHLTQSRGGWELTTYLTLKRGGDSATAISVREKFFLDGEGKSLLRQERSWEAAEGANASTLQTMLAKLNGKSLPPAAEAQAFVSALLPVLSPAMPSGNKARTSPSTSGIAAAASPPAPEPSPAASKATGPLYFLFNEDAKSNREDGLENYSAQSKTIVQGKFVPYIKNEKLQSLRFEMVAHVNSATGSISRIEFKVLEHRGNMPASWLRDQFESLANEVHRRFRFKSSVEGAIKATFTLKAG